MSCGRETKNVWWYFSRKDLKGKWYGWYVFSKQFWRHRTYIFHDSIGQYFNRFFTCNLIGHKHVHNIADIGEPVEWYCFKCEQRVGKKDFVATPPKTARQDEQDN